MKRELTVIVGRTESVLLDRPTRRKDHKVGNRSSGSQTGTGEYGENTGIAMIKADRVNDHELGQVVFVGHIVAMPGHHIEDTVVLFGDKQAALELGYDLEIFKG